MTEDEWSKLPPKLKASLAMSGLSPRSITPDTGAKSQAPYTKLGAASLKGEAMMPTMSEDIGGVTVSEGINDDNSVPTSTNSFIAYNPEHMRDPKTAALIRGHEMEHVLANQGGGQKMGLYEQWGKLATGEDSTPKQIVERLQAALPHLQKNWGLPAGLASGYFEPTNIRQKHLLINEMLPTLSALEQMNNRKLTDDPYLRENVFKTPGDRETYNAITGLRQTRLDAKDLPPYTRQAEAPEPGFMDKIKSMLKLGTK